MQSSREYKEKEEESRTRIQSFSRGNKIKKSKGNKNTEKQQG